MSPSKRRTRSQPMTIGHRQLMRPSLMLSTIPHGYPTIPHGYLIWMNWTRIPPFDP